MPLQQYVRQLRPRNESYVPHIDKVQSYLTEGSTEAAKEMEYLLVHVSKGRIPAAKKNFKNLKPYAIKNGFKTPEDLGKQILKNAGLSGTSGSMVDNQPVNKPTWKGDNTTPKTDIIIDRKKISLKKGSSQLMSGGPAESGSTFEVAASKVRGMQKQLDALAKECEEGIKNLMPSTLGTEKGGADAQKAAGTFNKDEVLKSADDFNLELKNKFRALFKSNVPFAKEFVFEAMTGKVKFNDNNGTATHFLVVDFDGSAEFHQVKKSSDRYVATVLPKVNPDVKFKSTSQKKVIDGKETKTGYYRFWSVVGLGYKAAVAKTEELMNEVENGNMVYMSEGFLDTLQSIWKAVKKVVSDAFTAIKDWLVSSALNFAEFLGLELDISFSNEIRW
jgi:hypothetical protein